MASCKRALKRLASFEFREWNGLPASCTPAKVRAVFAPSDPTGAVGLRKLGTEGVLADAQSLVLPEHDELITMISTDSGISLLEVAYPNPVGGVDGVLEALGEPAATLSFHWGVRELDGELVWPAKGITLYINPADRTAKRVAVYAPTTLDRYLSDLRLDLEVREFRER